jgi:hypothetical protein
LWLIVRHRLARRRPGVRLGLQFLEDLLDAILLGDRLVEEELELGHAAQADPLGDLAPQERQGAASAFSVSRSAFSSPIEV